MENKLKINLSRNRLFNFNNAVVSVFEYKEDFQEKELNKAIKMLSLKMPFLSSFVSLEGEGEAFVNFKEESALIQYVSAELNSFVESKRKAGVRFNENLFEFFVLNKNTLVLASHTVVSDLKSHLFITEELLKYYTKETVLINESNLMLFNEAELPEEVNSFVAQQVSEKLDNDWEKKKKTFSFDDYEKAEKYYFEKSGEAFVGFDFEIDNELYEKLSLKLSEMKVDFSSALAFALHSALNDFLKPKVKNSKAIYYFDRRLYFCDTEKYKYGAFDGGVAVTLPKKTDDFHTALKSYQDDIYKKVETPFNTFYNEYFLSLFSPSFLDSCYLSKGNRFKSKATQKLSKLYFCDRDFLLGFNAVNLNQDVFGFLTTFLHKMGFVPPKTEECVSATLIISEKIKLCLDVKTSLLRTVNPDSLFRVCLKILEEI